jgi:hypothetical protein
MSESLGRLVQFLEKDFTQRAFLVGSGLVEIKRVDNLELPYVIYPYGESPDNGVGMTLEAISRSSILITEEAARD